MPGDSDSEADAQRPIKQTFCGSLRRDAHWKCLILTLLIAGCLAAIVWCRVSVVRRDVSTDYPAAASSTSFFTLPGSGRSSEVDSPRDSPCNDGYVYIPVAFVIMLYLVYLVECWHSHTRIELQYKVDINTVYDKVRDMREGVPIIWWKAICYHYVRRTRQVTRYRNGDAFTSTQVYYERVNTCTAGSAFNFTQCGAKDISRPLYGLEDYPATKIRFSKGFSFASVDSECEFEDQRAQFFQEYESRDDYMEGREGMDILNVNFKEYMIAFADPDNLPWYVSHVIFWVASFLLLSWPLRVIIEYKTAHLHYHVHKLFGTNYVDVEEFRGTLSRVSTMNSTELEMNIRNNNILVPSYSEAMLMNAARRGSLLVTSALRGSRLFLGATTPRSLTNPTLSTSRSGGFVRGSVPSISMTTVRRFNSCTAISDRDKPLVIAGSRSSFQSSSGPDIFLQRSQSLVPDENTCNQRSDRRRWRRKRPASFITFGGTAMGTMLPTTPETPEGYVIELNANTGSAVVTHFHAEDDGATTTVTTAPAANFPVREELCTSSERLLPPDTPSLSHTSLPFADSMHSIACSEQQGAETVSTPMEVESPPPAYSEALTMPKLRKSQSLGPRPKVALSHGQPRPEEGGAGNKDGRAVVSNVFEAAAAATGVRPKRVHSDSVRLHRSGSGNHVIRFSMSEGSPRSASERQVVAVTEAPFSALRPSRSDAQGFGGGRVMRHPHTELSSVAVGQGRENSVGKELCRQAVPVYGMSTASADRNQFLQTERRLSSHSGPPGYTETVLAPSSRTYDFGISESRGKSTQGKENNQEQPIQAFKRFEFRTGTPSPLPRVISAHARWDRDDMLRPSRDGLDVPRGISPLPSVVATSGLDFEEADEEEDAPVPDVCVSATEENASGHRMVNIPARGHSRTVRPRDDARSRLISPSTAQRCYRSIQCMETSL